MDREMFILRWYLAAAFVAFICGRSVAAGESSAQGTSGCIYGVLYLGTARPDTDSVNKKIAQAGAIAKKQQGRICLTNTAMEFSAKLSQMPDRYVTGVVFGRGNGAHASFQKDRRILLVEANGRAWLFYRETGFDQIDEGRVLEFFEKPREN